MLACLFLNYTRGGKGDLKADRRAAARLQLNMDLCGAA